MNILAFKHTLFLSRCLSRSLSISLAHAQTRRLNMEGSYNTQTSSFCFHTFVQYAVSSWFDWLAWLYWCMCDTLKTMNKKNTPNTTNTHIHIHIYTNNSNEKHKNWHATVWRRVQFGCFFLHLFHSFGSVLLVVGGAVFLYFYFVIVFVADLLFYLLSVGFAKAMAMVK